MKRSFYFIIFILITPLLQAQSLNEKLRAHIFINVHVNKSECFVDEPIIATYKLYSSLESNSEVMRDPAFHGFSVRDLINTDDDIVTRETIDGVKFDVHLLRKVQLTPNESGNLQADAIVMQNSIRLIDANGKRSPLLGDENYTLQNGFYNLTISSVPVAIKVNALPTESRPAQLKGNIGNFKMNVQLSKNIFKANEEGLLTITILGSGNFNEVTMPAVEWPAGVEAFTPKVSNNITNDSLTSGYKSFSIPFSVSAPGSYTIKPVQFSYFDAVQNRYNTITNRPLSFIVVEEATPLIGNAEQGNDKNESTNTALFIGVGVLALLLVLLLVLRKKSNKKDGSIMVAQHRSKATDTTATAAADEYLQPARAAINQPGSTFYSALKQGVIHFFDKKFEVPAALFNRTSLRTAMEQRGLPQSKIEELLNLLTEIEMNIYSGNNPNTANKSALLGKVRNALYDL